MKRLAVTLKRSLARGVLILGLVAAVPALLFGAPPYSQNTSGTTIDGVLSALTDIYNSLTTIAGNTGGATPAGTNVIGKVGIDQTTPGTTNLVQMPEAGAVNGTCSAACNGTALLSIDTLGLDYGTIVTQTTVIGSGGTLVPQFSDDNVTFTTANCFSPGVNLVPLFSSTNGSFVNVQNVCPVTARYFRFQFTSYTSGTYTAIAYGRHAPIATYVNGLVQTYQNPYPANSSLGVAAPVTSSSGNVAAATATATLPAVANKTTYITGFEFTSSGATAASVVTCTLTNTISGTMTYILAVVAGATLGNQPLLVQFNPPIPANAANTTIVASCPSLGAGNTNAAMTAHGYQL